MQEIKTFPFGQPIVSLAQSDRSPKRVFILGVYASAVHARWVGEDGRSIVKALAVASEPEIFWNGEGESDIIAKIPVPLGSGKLLPLVHPRQAAKLGSHSAKWSDFHESWMKDVAPNLL